MRLNDMSTMFNSLTRKSFMLRYEVLGNNTRLLNHGSSLDMGR
jgi:hypothetical protein